jgi:hypothetical protein
MMAEGVTPHNNEWILGRSSKLCAVILALAVGLLALVNVSAASAALSWETVGNFAPKNEPAASPEEVQLGGVGGMAVNVTGAGGVNPGTIYTIGRNLEGAHLARYSAAGDFELAWTDGGRCGPKAAPPSSCPPAPTGSAVQIDVAVNQATGNVYAFATSGLSGANAVKIFRPDGTGPIGELVEKEIGGKVSTSPAKLHGTAGNENIAVNSAGTVYVYDEDTATDGFHRIMVFKPKTPGSLEYEYAGQSHDIAAGPSGTNAPLRPAVDDAGNVYVGDEGSIEEYDPAQPNTPTCTFSLPSGGITSMTVNPATGAPFYYASKPPKRQIHQLAPCNAEGKFVEKDAGGEYVAGPPFSVNKQRGEIYAMTFNPTVEWSENRPHGVLYAGTPEACPTVGSCPAEAVGKTSLGYIFAPLALPEPPLVISESVTRVGQSSATLNTGIDPNGLQTRYAFQYITDAAYEANDPSERFAGAAEAPAGGGELGNGHGPAAASVTLFGLAPGETYRYRVLATSPAGSVEGAAERFSTFAQEAPGLPDGRAWELVSPVQKNSGEVLPAAPNTASCGNECKPGLAASRYPTQVSPGGDGIAYQGSPFSLNEGPAEFDEFVSARGPNGWQTRSLGPPLGDNPSFEAFALSSDLGSALLYAGNPALTPEAPAGYRNIFAQPGTDRFDLEPALRTTPPNREGDAFKLKYAGASADLSRVFFEANDALSEETPFAPAAVDGGAKEKNLYEWSEGQLRLVNVQPGNTTTNPGAEFGSGVKLANPSRIVSDFSHAISADGSRVFWSSESGQVYVRENAQTTREIADHSGKFLTASADGSKLLLNDGHLFELDNAETMVDLTEGKGGFEGVAGQSEDLSHVYFVDTEVLDETANEQGDVAVKGKDNLYAWQGGSSRFIGTLTPTDNAGHGVWHASPVQRAAEASPDGRWLAFNSEAELTGIDSIGACDFKPDLQEYVGSVPCEEVFLYDSDTGALTCASCNPVGEHPHGDSFLPIANSAKGSQQQPRYLTNSGRLYFDSRDSLVLHDTNSKVEDVYEYEPEGVGACAKQGGCISLISAGHEANDSNFLAADEDGKNVFFTSRDQLALKDKDDLIDLYDAREGGGIPSETETGRSECQGEACQPLYVAPNDPTPGSSSFEGAGNVEEKKARNNRKRKHAKKHKHASKHKRSHGRAAKHNRGGAK